MLHLQNRHHFLSIFELGENDNLIFKNLPVVGNLFKSEGRYKSLMKTNPSEAEALYEKAEKDAATRMSVFKAVGELLK